MGRTSLPGSFTSVLALFTSVPELLVDKVLTECLSESEWACLASSVQVESPQLQMVPECMRDSCTRAVKSGTEWFFSSSRISSARNP
jgi:hypothetical protein